MALNGSEMRIHQHIHHPWFVYRVPDAPPRELRVWGRGNAGIHRKHKVQARVEISPAVGKATTALERERIQEE